MPPRAAPCTRGRPAWRNVGSGRSKATSDAVGLVVLHHVDQHRREAEHRVGDLTARRCHVGRQREERAIGQRVAVEEQVGAHAVAQAAPGRSAPARIRSATSRIRVRSLIAVRWMNVNAVRLRHPALVDQHALGAVDHLAGFELLAECVDLARERLQLAEAARSPPRSPGSGRSSGTASRGYASAPASRACSTTSRWLNAVRISTPQRRSRR